MKITVAFIVPPAPGMMPNILSAYDEWQYEDHCGVPERHRLAIERHKEEGGEVRELVVEISGDAVTNLFETPTTKGEIVNDSCPLKEGDRVSYFVAIPNAHGEGAVYQSKRSGVVIEIGAKDSTMVRCRWDSGVEEWISSAFLTILDPEKFDAS